MTNTNCPNCHSYDCGVAEAQRKELAELESDHDAFAWMHAQQNLQDAQDACAARAAKGDPPVDWRSRALTETARADAAEARAMVAEAQCDALNARINAVAKFEWAEWMTPMLDGLAMVLVQAERTGRPVATRLMCRVEGPGGDDGESEDVPMVSVWATTGDGNPIDRCAELSAKVVALGGEP
jgi:hypothetical protein